MNSNQKEVYDSAAKPIIDSVLEGFNGTIFAYGQTSSGKTHTMQGPDIESIEMQGIIPRMVRTVFNRIETASEAIEFTVKVSMVEIYMEKIRDLIDPSKDNLRIHEEKGKGVYIQDVEEIFISEEKQVYELIVNCDTIGTDKHGCCVMQRCLEKGLRTQKLALADKIIERLFLFIEDPFGNYLV